MIGYGNRIPKQSIYSSEESHYLSDEGLLGGGGDTRMIIIITYSVIGTILTVLLMTGTVT
jgi:hypothetical protein